MPYSLSLSVTPSLTFFLSLSLSLCVTLSLSLSLSVLLSTSIHLRNLLSLSFSPSSSLLSSLLPVIQQYRQIELMLPNISDPYSNTIKSCTVTCLSGLCGNSTLDETDSHFKSPPQSGFADGPGTLARFAAPESVAFLDGGHVIVVADTGNFLIRWIDMRRGNRTTASYTSTLAGVVIPGL